MKRTLVLMIGLLTLLGWAVSGRTLAASPDGQGGAPPLLIVVADKLDSIDVFQSKLPGLRRLLRESSSGLMSIRSGSGYTKSNSGYLSLGAGTRCTAPDQIGGLMSVTEPYIGVTAGDFWSWVNNSKPVGLVVPEVGWAGKLAQKDNPSTLPGLLGGFFRANHWQTVVYSNSDRLDEVTHLPEMARPGGLLMMDQEGIVDGGQVDATWIDTDPHFPYLKRVNPDKAFTLLQEAVKPRRVIMFDFDDFARLDYHRDEMVQAPYQHAKQASLRRLDHLLLRIMNQWPVQQLSLVVVSPSNSLEAVNQKRFLGPLMIRAGGYRPGGVLTSGTTNWDGIVSNIDFLPTMLTVAHLAVDRELDGRVMRVVTENGQLPFLMALHQRINAALAVQRPILDWYLGLITAGWLLGLVCSFFKLGKWSEWVLTGVAVIPLVLILMPLLPVASWQLGGFLGITLGLAVVFNAFPDYQMRFLVLAAITWAVLIVDQATGWQLIRYSPLGYSPASVAWFSDKSLPPSVKPTEETRP